MIRSARTALALLLALSWLALPAAADAACEFTARDSADQYLGSLDLLNAQGCFGLANDPSPLTKSVTKALAEVTDDLNSEVMLIEQRDKLATVLEQIEGSLVGTMSTMNTTWRGYATITVNELVDAKEELRNLQSVVRATYWSRHSDHAFFESETTGDFLISYEDDIRTACSSSDLTDDCRQNLDAAGELTRHITLVQTVLKNPVRRDLRRIHEQVAALDAEWDYYFYKARSQFWWEFIANNALYDPAGNVLAPPPDAQLILLHPNAAMEYVDGGATVESAYNLVGIVELIGYNRLRWKKGGPYSKWPLGISVIMTYIPATSGDDIGYGLMLHVKNDYSFGATRRDTGSGDETTWLFSVDLTKLFLEKSAEAKELYRSIR